MTWNLLQISDALDLEFGSALAERVPLIGWKPERVALQIGRRQARTEDVNDPPLSVRTFPLQRGFSRWPVAEIMHTAKSVCSHLERYQDGAQENVLVCTSPFYAGVAERWRGPVVYWLTDRIEFYQGVNRRRIHKLDKRLCAAAALVCPNSHRLAEYLEKDAACSPAKILILPNATRETNLLASTANSPSPLPRAFEHLRRPVAGVIGNMAGNIDWLFLRSLMQATPFLQWAFVGPTTMSISDRIQGYARDDVMNMSNSHFIGGRPYGELATYARSFDVAVLPYQLCEPTYSGSSTRFYEHLAAGRPMLATKGFEELLNKAPLVTLVDSAAEGAKWLRSLQEIGFEDGEKSHRLLESRRNTWQWRAKAMVDALHCGV